MTRLPLYHETAGLGRAGWPRGDCLVLDEVHGLSPGRLHDRIRTLVETATRALSPLPPPDGLLTPAEAARRLRCSVKTLNAHVAAGDVRYVSIGKGRKRPRKMFTDADLDAFITAQTRKDSPCPFTASRVRRSSTSNSASEVIAFTDQPKPRPGGTRKR